MTLIIILATLTAKPGQEDVLREILSAVVSPSRNETGCLLYTLHESTEEPGTFVFHEKWADQEAVESHITSPHYQQYRQQSADLLLSRTVHKLKEIH